MGGRLSALPEYDTFGDIFGTSTMNNRASSSSSSSFSNGDFLGGSVPAELIASSSRSVGKALLRQMGWREGQGVGPRIPMPHVVKGLVTEVG